MSIYAITGFFGDVHGQFPFGGFFQVRENLIHGDISGTLVDYKGSSDITGVLKEGIELKFDKTYHSDRSRAIRYEFKPNGKGIWVGLYQFPKGTEGRAVCRTTEHWQKTNWQMRKPSPDEWAADLVQSMVDQGLLEVVDGSDKK